MKKIGFLSFGHWTPSPQSQTRSAADTLLQSIELAVAAEELGADGAYFRVHHFARQLASPFPLLAAVGARTSKIEIGRDWQITPNASFYTLLRQSRSDLGGGRTPGADNTGTVELVALDATQLRGEIPCSYRLTNQAFLNFGLRGSLRGRSMLDDDFSLTELVEFWAFAGLTLRFASGRDTGSWLSM